jgi:hypothetical protein
VPTKLSLHLGTSLRNHHENPLVDPYSLLIEAGLSKQLLGRKEAVIMKKYS